MLFARRNLYIWGFICFIHCHICPCLLIVKELYKSGFNKCRTCVLYSWKLTLSCLFLFLLHDLDLLGLLVSPWPFDLVLCTCLRLPVVEVVFAAKFVAHRKIHHIKRKIQHIKIWWQWLIDSLSLLYKILTSLFSMILFNTMQKMTFVNVTMLLNM